MAGTNFHQHSDGSFLDGCSSPKDICDRAVELGFKYVCLSDHGNVSRTLDMYDEAKAHGLIPVLGTELYFKDDRYDNGKTKGFHLCVWALTEEGLHNVWAISSNTYYGTGEGHRTPNAKWEHFEGLGKGVACTSACIAGAISAAARRDDEEMALYFVNRYREIFDEFYIEIHTNSMAEQRSVNLWLIDFAKRNDIKCVYAVDSHYARKEDAEFHDMWLGCQIKAFYDQQHWTMDHEYYMQGEDEVRQRLEYLGDDLHMVFDGIEDLLSKVQTYEIDNAHKVPKFPLPEGWTDAGAYLKFLVVGGLLRKVGGMEVIEENPKDELNVGTIKYKGEPKEDLTPYIKQLTEVELPIILNHNLSDYFLIVSDYCKYAKTKMLVGPGRGSCTASILCYVLDITEVNPMGQGLIFGRFLNEGRMASLPDIDLDFPDVDKHLIHEYLAEKYGEDHVTAVGVTTFFGIKLALKEVCRYYRIPVPDANRMTSLVGDLEEMAHDGDWEAQIPMLEQADQDFLNMYKSSYPELFNRANKMVGLARQPGKHAAGYVISPEPLAKILPIRKSSSDEIISQFDKVAVERMGFLKADILGLRNLTTLSMAARFVKERKGVDIDFYALKDDPNDDEVWKIFEEGRTLGIFQLEKEGITGVAKALKPRSISEISTILALYRPGVIHATTPEGIGMLDEYLMRATGQKEVEYITPKLEPILKDTYGTIVYQEQAMRIFTDLADFTDEEADHIRAAIGKKKLEKIKAEKPKFIANCEKNGVSRYEAEEIFSQIEASGSYSFNKAHSYGYGTITYWTAYMKAHYPVEYYAACMTTVGPDKATLYIREAKRHGIKIVPPVLSGLSGEYTIISDNEIAFGLTNVKQVGWKAIDKILAGMPYKSFEDFVDRSGANSRVIKQLINGGIFREIYPNRRELMMRYESGDFRANLFEESLAQNELSDRYIPYPDDRIIEIETEIFGMPLSIDPFDDYRAALGKTYEYVESRESVEKAPDNSSHIMLVRVDGVRTHMSKRGQMAFVTMFTDSEEKVEATCFSTVFGLIRDRLREGNYLVVEVNKSQYNGKMSLVMNKALKIERKQQ